LPLASCVLGGWVGFGVIPTGLGAVGVAEAEACPAERSNKNVAGVRASILDSICLVVKPSCCGLDLISNQRACARGVR
jgi:hypothetical protein